MPFPLLPLALLGGLGVWARMTMRPPGGGRWPAEPEEMSAPLLSAPAPAPAPAPVVTPAAPAPPQSVPQAAPLPEHPFRSLLGPERFAAYKRWEADNLTPEQVERLQAQLREWVSQGGIDARHVCVALHEVTTPAQRRSLMDVVPEAAAILRQCQQEAAQVPPAPAPAPVTPPTPQPAPRAPVPAPAPTPASKPQGTVLSDVHDILTAPEPPEPVPAPPPPRPAPSPAPVPPPVVRTPVPAPPGPPPPAPPPVVVTPAPVPAPPPVVVTTPPVPPPAPVPAPAPAPVPAPAPQRAPVPAPAPAPAPTPPPTPPTPPADEPPEGFNPESARKQAARVAKHLQTKGRANYSRQTLREWQRLAGIGVDGIYGGESEGALRFYLQGARQSVPAAYFKPTTPKPYRWADLVQAMGA